MTNFYVQCANIFFIVIESILLLSTVSFITLSLYSFYKEKDQDGIAHIVMAGIQLMIAGIILIAFINQFVL